MVLPCQGDQYQCSLLSLRHLPPGWLVAACLAIHRSNLGRRRKDHRFCAMGIEPPHLRSEKASLWIQCLLDRSLNHPDGEIGVSFLRLPIRLRKENRAVKLTYLLPQSRDWACEERVNSQWRHGW